MAFILWKLKNMFLYKLLLWKYFLLTFEYWVWPFSLDVWKSTQEIKHWDNLWTSCMTQWILSFNVTKYQEKCFCILYSPYSFYVLGMTTEIFLINIILCILNFKRFLFPPPPLLSQSKTMKVMPISTLGVAWFFLVIFFKQVSTFSQWHKSCDLFSSLPLSKSII